MQFAQAAMNACWLLGLCLFGAEVCLQGSAANLLRQRTSGGNPALAAAAVPNQPAESTPALPVALAKFADQCRCQFSGVCGCQSSVQFLNCIADACNSGACECSKENGPAQFHQACMNMSGLCPSAGLTCSAGKASCTHVPHTPTRTDFVSEMLEKLAKLKAQKCKHEQSFKAGYINADNRLRELEPKIQAYLEALKEKGVKTLPDMHCNPDDLHVWQSAAAAEEVAPEPAKNDPNFQPLQKAAAQSGKSGTDPAKDPLAAMAEKHNSKIVFSYGLLHLLFLFACAYFYNNMRFGNLFPQSSSGDRGANGAHWSHGLCSCYQDPKLSLFTCCCPILRWADTMDKAGGAGANLPSYWKGFCIMAGMYFANFFFWDVLHWHTVGWICTFAFVTAMVMLRQRLRARFQITSGSCGSVVEDVAVYSCCGCCAIVQEAREVEGQLTSDARKAAQIGGGQ